MLGITEVSMSTASQCSCPVGLLVETWLLARPWKIFQQTCLKYTFLCLDISANVSGLEPHMVDSYVVCNTGYVRPEAAVGQLDCVAGRRRPGTGLDDLEPVYSVLFSEIWVSALTQGSR